MQKILNPLKKMYYKIKKLFNIQKKLRYRKDFYILEEEIVPNSAQIRGFIASTMWKALEQTMKDRVLAIHMELEKPETGLNELRTQQAQINELRYLINLPYDMQKAYKDEDKSTGNK